MTEVNAEKPHFSWFCRDFIQEGNSSPVITLQTCRTRTRAEVVPPDRLHLKTLDLPAMKLRRLDIDSGKKRRDNRSRIDAESVSVRHYISLPINI